MALQQEEKAGLVVAQIEPLLPFVKECFSTTLNLEWNGSVGAAEFGSFEDLAPRPSEDLIGVDLFVKLGNLEKLGLVFCPKDDIRVLLGHVIGMQIPREDFELDIVTKESVFELLGKVFLNIKLGTENFPKPVEVRAEDVFLVSSLEKYARRFKRDEMVAVVLKFAVTEQLDSEVRLLLPCGLFAGLEAGGQSQKKGKTQAGAEEPSEPQQQEPEPGAEVEEMSEVEQRAAEPEVAGESQVELAGGEEKTIDKAGKPEETGEALPEEGQAKTKPAPAPAPKVEATSFKEPGTEEETHQGRLIYGKPSTEVEKPQEELTKKRENSAPAGDKPEPEGQGRIIKGQERKIEMSETLENAKEKMANNLDISKLKRESVSEVQPAVQRDVKLAEFEQFDEGTSEKINNMSNLKLVMSIPIEVSVELGRTHKKIKEVLEYGKGTIIQLDRQAGAQVDVIVNGQKIARGDVVVVDENFGVRITEIAKPKDILDVF